jgi:hypothetical protein
MFDWVTTSNKEIFDHKAFGSRCIHQQSQVTHLLRARNKKTSHSAPQQRIQKREIRLNSCTSILAFLIYTEKFLAYVLVDRKVTSTAQGQIKI